MLGPEATPWAFLLLVLGLVVLAYKAGRAARPEAPEVREGRGWYWAEHWRQEHQKLLDHFNRLQRQQSNDENRE